MMRKKCQQKNELACKQLPTDLFFYRLFLDPREHKLAWNPFGAHSATRMEIENALRASFTKRIGGI
jgi:hypothetical protein